MQTMDGIFTNLKRMFQSGNILSKLIYINVGLFILIRLASVLFMLFNVQGVPFLQYLQLPASPELLLFRPWTLFTYMFTHFDFLHILFNMLWLYWFGGLFLISSDTASACLARIRKAGPSFCSNAPFKSSNPSELKLFIRDE